jgi:hypothetical protein
VRSHASERDRSILGRVSDEFGEAIALTVELGGVLVQFSLADPALLEQRSNQNESLDVKENAFNLPIRRS